MTGLREMEKRIRFLTAITEGMLSSVDLDEIIYVILSGITSGDGMGYNRAFLFLLDEHRRSVTCRMAVGPASRLEAHRIWEEMEEKRIDLRSLIAGFRRIKGDPRAWSLTKAVSSFSIAGKKIGAGLPRRRELPRGRLSLRTLVNLCMSYRLSFADNRCRVSFGGRGAASPLVFRRFVIVPLVYRRETVGAVLADNIYAQAGVRRSDIRALRDVANLAALAIERARLYEKMKRLAEIDGLTGLLNRRMYEAKLASLLEQSVRSGQPLSLILLDIDNFKPINDRYGHLAGDDVLRRVGRALRQSLRAGDLSARYGGDEFAVVLSRTDLQAACKVAAKIARSVRRTGPGRGQTRVSVSVGVSSTQVAGRAPRRLMASADRALYRAKRLGRDRVEPAGA